MVFFGRERGRPPRGSGGAWAVRRRRGVSGKVLRTPREHGERPERRADQIGLGLWKMEDGSWSKKLNCCFGSSRLARRAGPCSLVLLLAMKLRELVQELEVVKT